MLQQDEGPAGMNLQALREKELLLVCIGLQ